MAAESRSAASSVPIEQVASWTRAPASRRARCCGHRLGGRLLQRLVGEQPAGRRREASPQPCAAAASSPPVQRPADRNVHAPRRCRRPGWLGQRPSRRRRATPRARIELRIGDVVDVRTLRRLDPGDHHVVEPALRHHATPDVGVDPAQRDPAVECEFAPSPNPIGRAAPPPRRCAPASPASRR